MLQKLVVDVFTIGGKYGAAADQAAENRERRFENRQAERYDGNGNRDDGGRLLRSGQGRERLREIR